MDQSYEIKFVFEIVTNIIVFKDLAVEFGAL